MKISLSNALKQAKNLAKFQGAVLTMDSFFRRKDKVVFVIGATGTGKSRLAIDLATRFPAEIVNSDKIQAYRGLDIVTNKVTKEECRGIPHHLLGTVDPYSNFTAVDFKRQASQAVESIVGRGRIPIIAGGSNSFVDALVNDCSDFQLRYNCCFLWVDVSLPVLHSFVSKRVDKMVEAGLVEEVREMFDQNGDYSRGIRRAIGVPELDRYFRAESLVDSKTRLKLLNEAMHEIKENTCLLACRQFQKINQPYNRWKPNFHRLDATEVFLKGGGEEEANQAWEKLVANPSYTIVDQFLDEEAHIASIVPTATTTIAAAATTVPLAAAAAASVPLAAVSH